MNPTKTYCKHLIGSYRAMYLENKDSSPILKQVGAYIYTFKYYEAPLKAGYYLVPLAIWHRQL